MSAGGVLDIFVGHVAHAGDRLHSTTWSRYVTMG